MLEVAIVGGSGYTGGELGRLLLSHPEVDLVAMTSRELKGKFVNLIHPHLRGMTDLKFIHPNALPSVDLIFLAMPHGMSSGMIDSYLDKANQIIDLSADFRLQSADLYRQFYGEDHPRLDLLAQFCYGIVELNRKNMRQSDLISSAGCNATASIMGLLPLIDLDIDIHHIVIDAKVGSSEAGRDISVASMYSERSGSIRSYQPTAHRHSAEIIDYFGIDQAKVSFSATSLSRIRGALATIHVIGDHDLTEKDLWKAYRSRYDDEPFVRLIKSRQGNFRYPDPRLLDGTNFVDVGFELDQQTNRIVILSALDNLMKGAAGQAVQALNVQQGWDERTALTFGGLFP